MNKPSNVLLTGASGLLGTELLKQLIADTNIGLIITGIHSTRKLPEIFSNSRIIQVPIDLNDASLDLGDVFANYDISTVIHLGAISTVKHAELNISSTFQTNVIGTVRLLETALQNKAKKFIYMSTDKVYGDQGNIKYTEPMSLKGRNVYELSKVCADMIAQSFNDKGLNTVIVRSCNMFGAGDLNFSRILPRAFVNYINNESPVLYEDSVSRIREFINVRDVASGIHLLIDYTGKERVFNFGSGKVYKISELFEKAHAVAKSVLGDTLTAQPYQIEKKDIFFPEIDFQEMDYSLSAKELGYVPKTTDHFDEYLKEMFLFYCDLFKIKPNTAHSQIVTPSAFDQTGV